MRREYTADCIKVMQAYVEGKQIQYKDDEVWIDIEAPDWDWHNWEYRIKPELKCRPFRNAEECWQEMQKHQPFGWIKCKGCCFNIVYVNNEYVGLADPYYSSISLSSKNSYLDNTFLDGTPFGIKEEE